MLLDRARDLSYWLERGRAPRFAAHASAPGPYRVNSRAATGTSRSAKRNRPSIAATDDRAQRDESGAQIESASTTGRAVRARAVQIIQDIVPARLGTAPDRGVHGIRMT